MTKQLWKIAIGKCRVDCRDLNCTVVCCPLGVWRRLRVHLPYLTHFDSTRSFNTQHPETGLACICSD
ncbi:GTPase Era [Clarias magur]|uniref:GTPase Era n=1 Tax=Clarias magur TaxID=1594786 RepID=A0A8J4XK87_CLAMG|nr:GTPase Era [Clarias magur]